MDRSKFPPQLIVLESLMSDEEVGEMQDFLLNEQQWKRASHEGGDENRKHVTIDGIRKGLEVFDIEIKERIHKVIEDFYGDLFFIPEVYSYSRWAVGDTLGVHCDSGYTGGELMVEHMGSESHGAMSIHLNDVASVLYLTDDYSGGEFYFINYDYKIKPKAGTAIIFPATHQYAHGVTELISGERITMTSFWPRVKSMVLSLKPTLYERWWRGVRNPESIFTLLPQSYQKELEPLLLPLHLLDIDEYGLPPMPEAW
jgi:hypothetical protein